MTTYRIGVGVVAVGIGLLVVWAVRTKVVIRVGATLLATALVLAGALVTPRLVYGDPNGPVVWRVDTGEAGRVDYSSMLKLGDTVLGHGRSGVRSIDVRTGRVRYTIPTGDDEIWAASDGSVAGVEDDRVEYFGRDGRRKWTAEIDRLNGVAAIADDRVVVVSCADRAGCRLIGLDRAGKPAWCSQPAVTPTSFWVQRRRGPNDADLTTEHYVATMAVASAERMTTVYDVNGKIIGRQPGSLFAQNEDLVVTRDGCSLRAWQDGTQRWRIDIPCDTAASGQLVARDFLYIEPRSEATTAIRLSDGCSHEFGNLRLGYYGLGKDSEVGVPGDDTVVERNGRHLTGRDAVSGNQLWTYDVAGRGTPGVSAENGSVTIYSHPDGRRAALTGHTDATFEVTVLDGRTGRRTGGVLLPRRVTDSYGVGPGLTVVSAAGTRAVGAPPS